MSETRKIAAILCADVVGYSRLAGADEDRILARLRSLRSDLIDPTIAVHHGRIVKRMGDGLLIEFRSVVDAVRCAVEVQTAMVDRNAGVPPERRIEFRIGIHLGDVVEEADGDLMGDGVNVASRLEGVAAPGAICLSEVAYQLVKGRLDLKVTDLGPTTLKNIADPVHAYSLQVGVPAEAKPTAKAAAPASRKARVLVAPFAAALVIVIAGLAWWFLSANRPAPVASNAPNPADVARLSIVVLPFANLAGDPAQDYLADALTDELTTGIARLRNTFVIARSTAFTYKGKPVDVKAIGRELGVRYVLEGSVQPSGNQVRVNAQLIDADSGAHLWAEQFDTARADLLQMQDEIVTHLAHTMEYQFPHLESARLKRSPPANPDAEDLALQCTAGVQSGGYIGKDADAGFSLCEQALALDPNNVRALTMLSIKYYLPILYGLKGDVEKADALLSRAIAADPDFAMAHHLKSWIFFIQKRFDEAAAENERAIALDPAMIDAVAGLAIDYEALGQFERSLEYFDKAIRLSPRDPILNIRLQGKATNYLALKQYDQTIDWARRAIASNPNNIPGAHAALIAALTLTGRDAAAHDALRRYLALPPSGPITIASWTAYKAQQTNPQSEPRVIGTWDRMIEGLRKAGMPEQ
jgi:adenylate cyclase